MKVTINLVEGKSFECNATTVFTEEKYAVQYLQSVDPNNERWLKLKYEVDFGEHQYSGNLNTGEVNEDFTFTDQVVSALEYFSNECPYSSDEQKAEAKEMLEFVLLQIR